MNIKFLFIFLFLAGAIHSQEIKLSGSITDSVGNPLEMATIIAINSKDGSMESYAVADKNGSYSLILPDKGVFSLTASFFGMKPQSREIDLGGDLSQLELDFMLQPDESQLEGVEVVYEMPIVQRGDTLIYNTDSFVNGTERKLGDVLKKMPGIEVNEDGEIEVEGKKVSKVMVEGKDFFDGDSKLATKNIPADALSKVEVLKNYNEIDQMRGLGNDQDNVAINLKLKEGKKNFWFGEVEATAGEGEAIRYRGSSKLFYYSSKTSINLLGDLNNTGDVPFTFRDYFNFTGGFRNFNRGGGTSYNLTDSNLGFLVMQNDRAKEIESQFVAASFSHSPSAKLRFTGFGIFSDNRTQFVQESLKQYIQTNATENLSSNSYQHNQLGMAKFSTVYKPGSRFQLDYDLLLKQSGQTENAHALSVFQTEELTEINPFEEHKANDPLSIHQNVNAYYTLDAKNIFAGYLQHVFQEEDPFYNAILELQPFTGVLPLVQDVDNFNINQRKNVRTHKSDVKLDHYYVINDLSNINISIGATLSEQQFDSSIFQLLRPGVEHYPEGEEYHAEVEYSFRDLFLGVHYKFKKGIFTFTPGLNLHQYFLETEQDLFKSNIEKLMLLPDLYVLAQFRQSESLRFNYRMTADFSDVNNYVDAYLFNNYNRLFRGNRNLENAIFHSVNLDYFHFNLFNFTNISAGLSYNKRIDAIRNNVFIEQINQVSMPVNSNFVDESASANGSFQKSFRKWKANLETRLSLDNLNLIVNNEYLGTRNFGQHYQASFETNFKKAPNLEIGYSHSINQYNNGATESIFYTDRPFANVDMLFGKGFSFTADYSYYNYYNREKTIRNEYAFLDANLFFQKPGSSWEFSFRGKNLLNVQSLNRDSFNETFHVTSAYFVQPRMLLASIRYNL